jgi:hypothetical protein
MQHNQWLINQPSMQMLWMNHPEPMYAESGLNIQKQPSAFTGVQSQAITFKVQLICQLLDITVLTILSSAKEQCS